MFSKLLLSIQIFQCVSRCSTNAGCFTELVVDGKRLCAMDPSFNSTEFPKSSSREALITCSMECLQTSSCLAYNFRCNSNLCQIFNQPLKSFSVMSDCQYYYKSGAGLLMNQSLLITVDNELVEFYVNGKAVPVASNFPSANNWIMTDTYELSGDIYVLAVKSFNAGGSGGLIAKTADNHVLTNASWKCTNELYPGWYKLDYDDSFWPAAFVGKRERDLVHAMPIFKPALWITDPSDCSNCLATFYCRKNFIDFVPAVKLQKNSLVGSTLQDNVL
ncbi:hypothetical protein HELRODRAFT_160749 [Helobdella robusta]|uniref:Apple domain-containing protein n=1 Tax=Helobdella robusta TaxID=6412 RepID=T1EQN9_HELRO|nr:hypothetical protein HELRODRAFT_160749 [Helobdella robusta]ESO06567.1 hypothetical protein HELRODRAFT_160749 [Helobdella robusta]